MKSIKMDEAYYTAPNNVKYAHHVLHVQIKAT